MTPNNLTNDQILSLEHKAFRHWVQFSTANKIDKLLEPFQNIEFEHRPMIREIREAKFRTRLFIANKLKITQEAVRNIELAETKSTISINTLRNIADALDCEFVYGFRTKCRTTIAKQIWDCAVERAREMPFYKSIVIRNLQERGLHIDLAHHMRVLIEDTEFRRQMQWSAGSPTSVHGSFRFIDREWASWQFRKR